MGGIICKEDCCHKFEIQKIDLRNAGKGRIAVSGKKRDGAKRFQIVRVSRCDTGERVYAAPIGVRPGECTVVKLDLDMRQLLNLDVGQKVRLQITKATIFGSVWWFLTQRDPAIRVSAWLALTSVFLGLLGVLLSLR